MHTDNHTKTVLAKHQEMARICAAYQQLGRIAERGNMQGWELNPPMTLLSPSVSFATLTRSQILGAVGGWRMF